MVLSQILQRSGWRSHLCRRWILEILDNTRQLALSP